MSDFKHEITEPVRQLMAMNADVVSAKYLAPILHMSESVIVKYAKDGTWDADRLGNYVISGGHVKFFRKDFLQKCGFIEPESEGPTTEQLLAEILQGVKLICNYILLKVREEKLKDEKTAGAGTPTD